MNQINPPTQTEQEQINLLRQENKHDRKVFTLIAIFAAVVVTLVAIVLVVSSNNSAPRATVVRQTTTVVKQAPPIHIHNKQQVVVNPPVVIPQPPVVVPVVPVPSSSSLCNDTVGNADIAVGTSISCPFAKNVLIAAAVYFQANNTLPDGISLNVFSPTTGQSYAVAYTLSADGSTLYATNVDASEPDINGNNDLSFGSDLANGTGPN